MTIRIYIYEPVFVNIISTEESPAYMYVGKDYSPSDRMLFKELNLKRW